MQGAPLSLIADRLTCVKGERMLFRDLTFSLTAGEGVELTGPNGVGKTSLLRILAGLSKPESGSVRIGGIEQGLEAGAIEFLSIRDGLKGALTALEHLSFWRDYSGAGAVDLDALLAAVGLSQQAALPAAALSSGQKRRLVLARAMLQARPILLMDEPLNALDAAGQDLLKGFVADRLKAGAIAVIATHLTLGLAALKPMRMGENAGGGG